MESPVPMSITRAKDATYTEINKAAVKYMGFKRKDIIGRRPSELGHYSKTPRHLYIDEIKKHGFAKNIPLEVHIKNQGIICMFFNVYPFKMGKDSYLLSVGTDISNNKPIIKSLHDDKFLKITLQDYKYVQAKLKHYKLTPRQREITLLSLAGHSNPEIAKKLSISAHTVKDHLKEIFRIIGVRYRSELFPKLLNLR